MLSNIAHLVHGLSAAVGTAVSAVTGWIFS
jgi:hypothetical protein